MSYIFKCDICGKDSAMTNVHFTPEPLEIEVDTYNGRKMNISLSLIMEDSTDTANIDRMSAILNDIMMKKTISQGGEPLDPSENIEDAYQDAIFENMDKFMGEFGDKLSMVNNTIGLKLTTPNPMMCDVCKRALAHKALTEGKFKVPPSTNLYSTDSLRVPPMDEIIQDGEIRDLLADVGVDLSEENDKIRCIECGKELKKETKTGKCRECYLNGPRKKDQKSENKPNDDKKS